VTSSSTESSPATLEVDLGALERNYGRLRERLPDDMLVIASVKANGYGHGAIEVARVLGRLGAYAVATASLDEAAAIRSEGAHDRVLLFGGQLPGSAGAILENGLIPTVPNAETAQALARAAPDGCRVFVKVDAGLGRLGVPLADAFDFVQEIRSTYRLLVHGLYTHLPFSNSEGEAWARRGLAEFTALVDRLRGAGVEPPVIQALSSPGISAGLPNPFTAVCPGRLLYGIAPAAGGAGAWGLEPVLRAIRTRLVHLSQHPAGARIGSGGRVALDAPGLVGVVPFGQSNGYRAAQSGQSEILHRGRRRRVIGVSLEHATIDLGDGPAEIGDEVVVLGRSGTDEITLADFAAGLDSDPLEALMALGGRSPYEYV